MDYYLTTKIRKGIGRTNWIIITLHIFYIILKFFILYITIHYSISLRTMFIKMWTYRARHKNRGCLQLGANVKLYEQSHSGGEEVLTVAEMAANGGV